MVQGKDFVGSLVTWQFLHPTATLIDVRFPPAMKRTKSLASRDKYATTKSHKEYSQGLYYYLHVHFIFYNQNFFMFKILLLAINVTGPKAFVELTMHRLFVSASCVLVRATSDHRCIYVTDLKLQYMCWPVRDLSKGLQCFTTIVKDCQHLRASYQVAIHPFY